ncbi:glycosyltransferase family 2 protein [bacterium]|nr:glycosyltransferase family 2 protein [candidate division CSSED10-310 bacterium]
MNTLCDLGLSVFIPAHNERENLEPLIRSFAEILPGLSPDPELLIIDDGSDDGTGELADELARTIPFLKVVHHRVNRGYGAALQSGFRESTRELVFYTDGDGQFRSEDLAGILPLIEQADIVSCFRTRRCDQWYRKLNTTLFEWTVRLWFGLKVKDPDCAYKIYRRKVLETISMSSVGAMIDVEMLLQAQRAGFRIVQTGVTHLPRRSGESSGSDIRVIFRAFLEIMSLWRRLGYRFRR